VLDRSAVRQRNGYRVRSTPFARARRRLTASGPATEPPREAGRRERRPTRARRRTTPSPRTPPPEPRQTERRAQSRAQRPEHGAQSAETRRGTDRGSARERQGRRPRRESRRILTDQKENAGNEKPRSEPASGSGPDAGQELRAQTAGRNGNPRTWREAWDTCVDRDHGESPWSPAANRPEFIRPAGRRREASRAANGQGMTP
jgi:hypothetical protein